MRLIENAGAIWHRLWSVRFAILASLVSAASAGWDAYSEGKTNAAALITFALSAAGGVARVIVQESTRG